jgi:hypothetical protein
MGLTFREYLERRQIGDPKVAGFLTSAAPEIFEAKFWPEIMVCLTANKADWDYTMYVPTAFSGVCAPIRKHPHAKRTRRPEAQG